MSNKSLPYHTHHTPNIEDLLSDLGHRQCKYFTTIDLSKAFFQTKLTENAKKIATFVTYFGCYSFNRAPYGVKIYQTALLKVLRVSLNSYCFSGIDDICIYSETFEKHLKDIQDILERLRNAGLTIEPNKIKIARPSIRFILPCNCNCKQTVFQVY